MPNLNISFSSTELFRRQKYFHQHNYFIDKNIFLAKFLGENKDDIICHVPGTELHAAEKSSHNMRQQDKGTSSKDFWDNVQP